MRFFSIKRTAAAILAIALLGATAASASEFKSWRTNNGAVIQQNGNAYLGLGKANILEAAALKMNLKDMNPLNDPLIIDIRSKAEYDVSRIPGAIWLANFNEILLEENLDKLDEALLAHINQTGNDNIVVYCHLGQMSGLTTGILGTMGYNVKTLKLGYNMGWMMDVPMGGM